MFAHKINKISSGTITPKELLEILTRNKALGTRACFLYPNEDSGKKDSKTYVDQGEYTQVVKSLLENESAEMKHTDNKTAFKGLLYKINTLTRSCVLINSGTEKKPAWIKLPKLSLDVITTNFKYPAELKDKASLEALRVVTDVIRQPSIEGTPYEEHFSDLLEQNSIINQCMEIIYEDVLYWMKYVEKNRDKIGAEYLKLDSCHRLNPESAVSFYKKHRAVKANKDSDFEIEELPEDQHSFSIRFKPAKIKNVANYNRFREPHFTLTNAAENSVIVSPNTHFYVLYVDPENIKKQRIHPIMFKLDTSPKKEIFLTAHRSATDSDLNKQMDTTMSTLVNVPYLRMNLLCDMNVQFANMSASLNCVASEGYFANQASASHITCLKMQAGSSSLSEEGAKLLCTGEEEDSEEETKLNTNTKETKLNTKLNTRNARKAMEEEEEEEEEQKVSSKKKTPKSKRVELSDDEESLEEEEVLEEEILEEESEEEVKPKSSKKKSSKKKHEPLSEEEEEESEEEVKPKSSKKKSSKKKYVESDSD